MTSPPPPLNMCDNILNVWERSTYFRRAGEGWYPVAQELAAEIGALVSDQSPVTVGAGIIAALSPRQQWTRNVAAAREVAIRPYLRPTGVFTANWHKAMRIAYGESPSTVLRGPKVQAFYRNILGDESVVTIDGWAFKIACPDSPVKHLERKGWYEAVSAAYIFTAKTVGVRPTVLQATTWLVAQNEGRREAAIARAAVRKANKNRAQTALELEV